ncbi:hypothetical protein BJY00DRAFT_308530 [Aspergillus carlsbadensis]|nr:hypothetical protein BJY00DRAFT_308530 [Aspergillus carlsbadensis]
MHPLYGCGSALLSESSRKASYQPSCDDGFPISQRRGEGVTSPDTWNQQVSAEDQDSPGSLSIPTHESRTEITRAFGLLGLQDQPRALLVACVNNISKQSSILVDVLSQGFSLGNINNCRVTFVDKYSTTARILEKEFGLIDEFARLRSPVALTLAGWCAGSTLNYIGPNWTVVFGGFDYPFYVGSLWYYDKFGHEALLLLGGALLGVTAALLWTTSVFIQFVYAEENDKDEVGNPATMIEAKWDLRGVLSSVGGTVGARIAFGANVHQTDATGVITGVWIAFNPTIALEAAVFLIVHLHPRDVVRAVFSSVNGKTSQGPI